MKILFLHGLESQPNCTKVEWLKAQGHHVYNPTLDYKNKDQFNECKKIIKAFLPELIIGSSMGGYFALELAKIYDIPVMLLNPALHSRSFEPVVEKLDPDLEFHPLVFIGLGKYDKVINYAKTLNILDDNALCFFRGNYLKGDHGHRTPLDFFKTVFTLTETRLKRWWRRTARIQPVTTSK